MSILGVHKTHCCVLHGCKYGESNCPVELGDVEQEDLCEQCHDEGIKTMDELYKILKEKKHTCKKCIYDLDCKSAVTNQYVIIRDHSAGNDTVGETWQETKIFNGNVTLDEVMAWGMNNEKDRDARNSSKRITITKPHK